MQEGILIRGQGGIYTVRQGNGEEYTLRAKSPVKWTMVYPEKSTYPDAQTELTFTAPEANTYIFMIAP